MQILIVEDEAKIRHFLRRGLLEESYAVDTAEDGEEALYKLDINEYDLVLLGSSLFFYRLIDLYRQMGTSHTI